MPDRFSPSLDDASRIAALYRYNLDDAAQQAEFERVTRLAVSIFETSIAMVSFLDLERQFFKGAQGMALCETDRDDSFCGYALVARDVLVVPDAADDPRFANNPLVTGEPHIRFYAGAPVITRDGFPLGTVCVIGREPRPRLSLREEGILVDLAGIVMDQLELRLENNLLKVRA